MLGLHACLLPVPALPGTQKPRPQQGGYWSPLRRRTYKRASDCQCFPGMPTLTALLTVRCSKPFPKTLHQHSWVAITLLKRAGRSNYLSIKTATCKPA